jgi:hypothetical protein
MSRGQPRDPHKEEFWRDHLARWQCSRLSVRASSAPHHHRRAVLLRLATLEILAWEHGRLRVGGRGSPGRHGPSGGNIGFIPIGSGLPEATGGPRRYRGMEALVLIGLLLGAEPAAESPLAGRPLRQWLEDLAARDLLVREEAVGVLTRAGPEAKEAVPRLEKMLRDEPSTLRPWGRWATRQPRPCPSCSTSWKTTTWEQRRSMRWPRSASPPFPPCWSA